MILSSIAQAQDTQIDHIWVDSLAVTTTEVDTTFPIKWSQVSLRFEGAVGLVKICGPDTQAVADRKWIRMYPGMVLEIGEKTGLKRLIYKAVSGTGADVCALFLTGIKYRYRQHSN